MTPSISLRARGLAWRGALASPLFSDLDLSLGEEKVGLVGPNGCGKTTLLRLLAGAVPIERGEVTRPARVSWLPQDAGDRLRGAVVHALGVAEPLGALERLLAGAGSAEDAAAVGDRWDLEQEVARALRDVGLAGLALDRGVRTLSGGERTRLALARRLLERPDALLLDEPTNHLDRAARARVAEWLRGFSGGALVASHDRELLLEVDRVWELRGGRLLVYGGNYDVWRAARGAEEGQREREAAVASAAAQQARRVARREHEKKARSDARGYAQRATGGQPKVVLNAQRERAQRTAARLDVREARRVQRAEALAAAAREARVRAPPPPLTVPVVSVPAGRTTLALEGVRVQPPGCARPVLDDVTVLARGPERVALTGANGAGKSTLLAVASGGLSPDAGRVTRVRAHAVVDQHASALVREASVIGNLRRARPDTPEGACRELLAPFGFERDAVFQRVATLSGGERTRAALACALLAEVPPELLLLDEPDNHLDPWTLEALVRALLAYRGALVVVTHQRRLVGELGCTREVELARGRVVRDVRR